MQNSSSSKTNSSYLQPIFQTPHDSLSRAWIRQKKSEDLHKYSKCQMPHFGFLIFPRTVKSSAYITDEMHQVFSDKNRLFPSIIPNANSVSIYRHSQSLLSAFPGGGGGGGGSRTRKNNQDSMIYTFFFPISSYERTGAGERKEKYHIRNFVYF